MMLTPAAATAGAAPLASISSTVLDGSLWLSIPLAALAGLVSFASPCVLPLVPGYLGYVAGLAGSQPRRPRARQRPHCSRGEKTAVAAHNPRTPKNRRKHQKPARGNIGGGCGGRPHQPKNPRFAAR